jgi:hypothetical protein
MRTRALARLPFMRRVWARRARPIMYYNPSQVFDLPIMRSTLSFKVDDDDE